MKNLSIVTELIQLSCVFFEEIFTKYTASRLRSLYVSSLFTCVHFLVPHAMSKPSNIASSSRPGSVRTIDVFSSRQSLKSLRFDSSSENEVQPSRTRLRHYGPRDVPYPLSIAKEALEL